ncbi:MAG: hypothetical protein RRC34_12920 [Lentisphaeria bacterium]|nr:hypothetical protein [Lentisphaeria bacterium]
MAMKIHRPTFLAATMMCLFTVGSIGAATIVTSGDISTAATNPDTADLGDSSITVGGFTVASTGIVANLGWQTFGGDPEFIGVVGGGKAGGVEGSETLTLSFSAPVTVNSISLADHGQADLNAIISGFSSDPGASVSGLPSGWTVSYASGSVTVATNNNIGYLVS